MKTRMVFFVFVWFDFKTFNIYKLIVVAFVHLLLLHFALQLPTLDLNIEI